ncbi:hypothetical protein PVNG_05682 [Plasmodium vivax North Korean]|uniref:Uncharacterized protein n=1 Tax=Plasmodium vivax North Korean TaxID=1035514 RepID=A0A0J9TSS6_PLAVI|nr:hypothetical protein PVNG_05682 [Plasmodium vivax North Korean]
MKYIDDLIFNKMKKLYKLYDAYEAFCEQIDIHEDLTNCNTLSDVINDFNGIIKSHKYPNSIYLFKELKKFKCLIEKNDLFTSGKCVSILPQLSTPQGDSTKDEVQCINQGQSEHRPGKFDVSPIHAMPMGEREPKEPLSVSQPSRSGVTIPLISGMTGMFGILLYKVNNISIHICYTLKCTRVIYLNKELVLSNK